MPPVNQQRRDALADAAIAIVAREGTHGLSHRSVDEAAGVPKGTTSNYFRSRDALLEATVKRVVRLHFDWIDELRAKQDGVLDRTTLTEIQAQVIDEAVTVHKDRYLAVLELLLESTRRPELHSALADTFSESVRLVHDAHLAEGLEPTDEQVQLLRVMYVGTLFGYIVFPDSLGAMTAGETTATMLGKIFMS